jgi:catechol 2,3-dioxygenase-like lactoylglutathione lyase family enzyme
MLRLAAPPRRTGQTRVVQPLAVHHVSVNVPDVTAATAFYTEVLGGTLRRDRPDFGFGGAWIDIGASQVHLLEAPTPPTLGQHFAVAVADLDATVAELRARGVEVDGPVPVGPGRQAFVADPAGNTVELYQGPSGP